ncbi:hypothetical protein DTO96_102534 [Ephemeroptericola cinctiostellae]|uniref:Uncharacterized protein n=1 Tax=Ephemeroptericola cinctiostellae TaxID=2268024 RepID=A0A345DEJ0_9BURK|nr:baseplate J/gp47 family protein [Ephemeroptericola cinctiostellae]AXF86778.1 hypothetical protein DTO96_102534 [Ephemeroptericola cinctiostellae]
MAYNLPTLAELDRQHQAELPLATASDALRRNLFVPLARALANAQHDLHMHAVWVWRQQFPRLCDDDVLESYHAPMRLREGRKAAFAASGWVRLKGVAGKTVDADTVINRNDGLAFVMPDGAIIGEDGMAVARTLCLTPGAAGNTEAGAVFSLSSPVSGVEGAVEVLAPGLSGGADIESIDSLRNRVDSAWCNPGEVGKSSDYEAWALEVAGVTRAWAVPKALGPGTVSVYFMRDDDPITAYPDAAECAAVQAHFDNTALPFGEHYAFAPVKKTQNFTIRLMPNTVAVQKAAEAAIRAYVNSVAAPVKRDDYGMTAMPIAGMTIPRSQIAAVISDATGEWSHEIILPAVDIECSVGELLEVGTLTFTG